MITLQNTGQVHLVDLHNYAGECDWIEMRIPKYPGGQMMSEIETHLAFTIDMRAASRMKLVTFLKRLYRRDQSEDTVYPSSFFPIYWRKSVRLLLSEHFVL